jgi:hypothetical protein
VLSLPELQARFAATLFEESPQSVAPWIRAAGIPPQLRLGIYRTNLQEGFAKTLALEFPVIQRLAGEDYFRQLALGFLAQHPSRSGDLHHIGAPFAAFLRARFAATGYEYFADVAALEWAWQECLVAEDDGTLDPKALHAVPPHSYAGLRFALRTSARLLESAFPIARIWEMNQPGASLEESIDLASGPQCVLLHRVATGARLTLLPPGEFALLSTLARTEPLEVALEAALARAPHFDLASALQRCFGLRVFAGISFTSEPSQGVLR